MKRFSDDLPAAPLVMPSMVIQKYSRVDPWTPERVEHLANALLDWLKDPSHYFITHFCVEYGITYDRFLILTKDYPFLQEVYNRAKDVQEVRLVELAVTRKGDP